MKDFVAAVAADTMNKGQKGVGYPQKLQEMIARLQPFIAKKKAKSCKEVMEEVNAYEVA